ncbi:MAG TPA: hypothetical protein VEB62_11105 [Brevundimonas sp.]|nr:hypothetical protein [Brevundimonas sp.]HYC98490.1 hypothetical protein [Brevundimonas sp.]
MTKAKAPAKPGKPDPSEREATEGKAAARRVIDERDTRAASRSALPFMEGAWTDAGWVSVTSSHNDTNIWTAALVESLGVNDPRAGSFLLVGALNGGWSPTKPHDEASAQAFGQAVECALAFVSDMQPTNAVEAALILQMAAAHNATMTLSRHAARADDREELSEHTRMMNATMRTFTAQAEALHKLRTGGKQQVEVRHVYVDARTQTVFKAGGQGGIVPDYLQQPHAPAGGALGYAPPQGLPVWGENARGDALPVASDQGEATLPDARRQEPRSTARRGERKLRPGTLDATDHRGEGKRSGSRQNVPGDAA